MKDNGLAGFCVAQTTTWKGLGLEVHKSVNFRITGYKKTLPVIERLVISFNRFFFSLKFSVIEEHVSVDTTLIYSVTDVLRVDMGFCN